jgi:hypothetical protein
VDDAKELNVLTLGYNPPAGRATVIGVLLLRGASDELWIRFADDIADLVRADDLDIFELLGEDLRTLAEQMGGQHLVEYLENTLSNILVISERVIVQGAQPEKTLRMLTPLLGDPFPATEKVAFLVGAAID